MNDLNLVKRYRYFVNHPDSTPLVNIDYMRYDNLTGDSIVSIIGNKRLAKTAFDLKDIYSNLKKKKWAELDIRFFYDDTDYSKQIQYRQYINNEAPAFIVILNTKDNIFIDSDISNGMTIGTLLNFLATGKYNEELYEACQMPDDMILYISKKDIHIQVLTTSNKKVEIYNKYLDNGIDLKNDYFEVALGRKSFRYTDLRAVNITAHL